ncbi:LysR family transcriptional regulator [Streptomyces pactum]|uniref:LysR family transcriptional regulator n=1 Tax=Streptomyces pactum TaxID=68249 RepID=A0ABS0NI28_9ACTN|nr:LysR family transcriptional regulator [Streptomyces pactum]MBH5334867.1 LysR family transcriptional regulator [Streptomyces pactum]
MGDWDIRKLRVLRTLHDLGTVTATAEALRLTPSAVSQALSGLAKQLGVPLLEAHGRRLRLTDAARLVLRHADEVLAQLERADAELAGHLRGETGRVRVGAFGTAVPALVVPAVVELRTSHPGLEIGVREAEAAEAYALLADGTVDLALSLAAHAPTARDARFTRLPLLADPLDVALPTGHPLATAPALRLADLAAERWIFGSSGPWSRITTAACEAAGFAPEQAHAAADWHSILAMVAAGMGVALVSRMALTVVAPGPGPRGVVVRELAADRPHRHVVAAVRRGSEGAPGYATVLDALRRAATAHSGTDPAPATVQPN